MGNQHGAAKRAAQESTGAQQMGSLINGSPSRVGGAPGNPYDSAANPQSQPQGTGQGAGDSGGGGTDPRTPSNKAGGPGDTGQGSGASGSNQGLGGAGGPQAGSTGASLQQIRDLLKIYLPVVADSTALTKAEVNQGMRITREVRAFCGLFTTWIRRTMNHLKYQLLHQ